MESTTSYQGRIHNKTTRVATQYYPSFFDQKKATDTYVYLRDAIPWEQGVKSRKTGFTRLAKPLDPGDNKVVDDILTEALTKLNLVDKYDILGIYLNYYQDGTHHTPAHSHQGMTQLIVSLGAIRTLRVGNKNYFLGNGDVIIFGSSTHSVPPEPSLLNTSPQFDTTGRISIATFMKPTTFSPIIELTDENLLELVKQISLMDK